MFTKVSQAKRTLSPLRLCSQWRGEEAIAGDVILRQFLPGCHASNASDASDVTLRQFSRAHPAPNASSADCGAMRQGASIYLPTDKNSGSFHRMADLGRKKANFDTLCLTRIPRLMALLTVF